MPEAKKPPVVRLASLKVKVTRISLHLDPTAYVWNIEVESARGVWKESYGSREHVDAFVRGLRAGNALAPMGSEFPEVEYVDADATRLTIE